MSTESEFPVGWPSPQWLSEIAKDGTQLAIWKWLRKVAQDAGKGDAHAAAAFVEVFSTLQAEAFRIAPRRSARRLFPNSAAAVSRYAQSRSHEQLMNEDVVARSAFTNEADSDWLAFLVRVTSLQIINRKSESEAVERAKGTTLRDLHGFELEAMRIIAGKARARPPSNGATAGKRQPAAIKIANRVRREWSRRIRKPLNKKEGDLTGKSLVALALPILDELAGGEATCGVIATMCDIAKLSGVAIERKEVSRLVQSHRDIVTVL